MGSSPTGEVIQGPDMVAVVEVVVLAVASEVGTMVEPSCE